MPELAAGRRARREAAPARGRAADTKGGGGGGGGPGEVAVARSAAAESGRARAAIVIITEALRGSPGGAGPTGGGAGPAETCHRPRRASATPHGGAKGESRQWGRAPPPRVGSARPWALRSGALFLMVRGVGPADLIPPHPLPQAAFWVLCFLINPDRKIKPARAHTPGPPRARPTPSRMQKRT